MLSRLWRHGLTIATSNRNGPAMAYLYNNEIWAPWRLELPINQMFVQQTIHTNNGLATSVSNSRITNPVWGESSGDWWIPYHTGSVMRKAFLIRDVSICWIFQIHINAGVDNFLIVLFRERTCPATAFNSFWDFENNMHSIFQEIRPQISLHCAMFFQSPANATRMRQGEFAGTGAVVQSPQR